jgi:DNA repair exonuclease SbcCD ATPase subunit
VASLERCRLGRNLVLNMQLEDSITQIARLQRQLQSRDDQLGQLHHRVEDLESQGQRDKDMWEELAAQQQETLNKLKTDRDEAVGQSRELQLMVHLMPHGRLARFAIVLAHQNAHL